MSLTGWGLHPKIAASTLASEQLERITTDAVLSRGLGRAYGDAALPQASAKRHVAISTAADRILSFDATTGLLTAEAGLSLSALARTFLPRGWFSPVSPGTQYVTLGGMVAADIHGKNHHVHGTVGNFIRSLSLRVADGRVVHAAPDLEPELFWATVGGMGLTGHILTVSIQLENIPSPWIFEESERFDDLPSLFAALTQASDDWPMTVSWIDTSAKAGQMGRGMVIRGRWATPSEAPPNPPAWGAGPSLPIQLPSGLMNRTSIGLANRLWFAKHGAANRTRIAAPHDFFWQLDMVRHWNRAYGARGFTQYQCIMPKDVAVYRRFLQLFQQLGGCSFVTVFKDCGPQGQGLLSFPQQGTSLALDIPISTLGRTKKMVDDLNAFVLDHGGRVYLAKDAFTSPADFQRMYPRFSEFLTIKRRWDPDNRIASALSERLFGGPVPGAL